MSAAGMSSGTKALISSVSVRSILFSLLLLSTTITYGYGFHDALNFGNGIDAVSIRSAALGGSKVFGANGPIAILLNPAGLSEVEGFMISTSGAIVAWSEAIVDSTATTKRAGTGFGTATGAVAFRVSPSFVFGAGAAKVMDNQGLGGINEPPGAYTQNS